VPRALAVLFLAACGETTEQRAATGGLGGAAAGMVIGGPVGAVIGGAAGATGGAGREEQPDDRATGRQRLPKPVGACFIFRIAPCRRGRSAPDRRHREHATA
jgi:hypothetical protein